MSVESDPPDRDWETYQLGDAGTQILNGTYGWSGSWLAEANYTGIIGEEDVESYDLGDAGTQTLNGGVNYDGSWWYLDPYIKLVGTEYVEGYVVGDAGTQVLDGGIGFGGYGGTWAGTIAAHRVVGTDAWDDYSTGNVGPSDGLDGAVGWSGTWRMNAS